MYGLKELCKIIKNYRSLNMILEAYFVYILVLFIYLIGDSNCNCQCPSTSATVQLCEAFVNGILSAAQQHNGKK